MATITVSLWHEGLVVVFVLQIDCDMMQVIEKLYWIIVLPIAYVLFGAVIIVYMQILHVARSQIKSIELLVLQVSVFVAIHRLGTHSSL